MTSDPGAAVRVHQLLDLRLRLLQRHPVSAALPFFSAPATGFRARMLLSALLSCYSVTFVGMGYAMRHARLSKQRYILVGGTRWFQFSAKACGVEGLMHSFATVMRIDVAVSKLSNSSFFR